MRIAVVVCALLAGGAAHADEQVRLIDRGVPLDDEWPAPPPGQGLTLDEKIVERMTELGNRAAGHIEIATRESVGLRIDGRHQRAHLRLTAGRSRYLTLQMDEDIHIGDGKARIGSRVDLGVAGHDVHLRLPDFEMVPSSYQNDRGVEVRVPIYERRW